MIAFYSHLLINDIASLQVWSLKFGTLIHSLGVRDSIHHLHFSSDNEFLAYSLGGSDIWLYNLTTRLTEQLSRAHDTGITDIQISSNSVFLVSINELHHLDMWDVASGELLWKTIDNYDCGPADEVVFSGDNSVLASVSHQGFVKLWDTLTGSLIGQRTLLGPQQTIMLKFLSNEVLLVVKGLEWIYWNIETQHVLTTPIIQTDDQMLNQAKHWCYSSNFDGTVVAATPERTLDKVHEVFLRRTAGGECFTRLDVVGPVESINFLGKSLLAVEEAFGLYVYDVESLTIGGISFQSIYPNILNSSALLMARSWLK